MGAPNASGLTRIALKLKDRFAAKVHNHAASDINSGTLDDARIPSLDASKIGSGTFGVARGGTGASIHTANAVLTGNGTSAVNNVATASGALYATAANGAAQFGTLPVAQGGTGADTAAGARTNLDAAQSDGASGTLALAETAIGNLGSSIATVEQTTATANHAAGDYFMLGNVLMKATDAIATGEQITTSKATPATVQGQIDTLRDSVGKKVSYYPSEMAMCFYAGAVNNQLFTIDFVCKTPGHSRNGHIMSLIMREDGFVLYDSTVGAWVWSTPH